MTDPIEQTADLLADADRVFVFAGSGFSQESGVPTFRGEDGLFADDEIAKLAYAETLEREPERALSWYQEGRDKIGELEPNPGHYTLALLSRGAEYTVATQNVDGLLERACAEEGVELPVHHIHGSLFRVVCHDCDREHDSDVDLSELPECEACGGLLRPDIVLFGELLPRAAFDAAVEGAKSADVCLLLGTSGIVHPAAGLPRQAKRQGATLVEVNPEATELSDLCDIDIRGKTGEVLPDIEQAMEEG